MLYLLPLLELFVISWCETDKKSINKNHLKYNDYDKERKQDYQCSCI